MTASDTAPYIASPDETSHAAWLGGKGAALAALRESGLPVPAWFALTPAAFDASLTTTQRAALECAAAAEDAAGLDAALAGVRLDSAIQVELGRALAALCPNGERVAVRSSAVDEDGMARSFAGQLESYLDVPPDQVVARVAAVWRSAFGARVLSARDADGHAGYFAPGTDSLRNFAADLHAYLISGARVGTSDTATAASGGARPVAAPAAAVRK